MQCNWGEGGVSGDCRLCTDASSLVATDQSRSCICHWELARGVALLSKLQNPAMHVKCVSSLIPLLSYKVVATARLVADVQVAAPSPAFFLPLPTEKLAEAQRRFTTLRTELQSTLDAQKEASGASTLPRRRKPVFHLSHEERVQHRNIKDLKLAFSELYLSLILLQNYQVSTEGEALWESSVSTRFYACAAFGCLIQANLPLHFSLRDPGFS